MGATVFALKKHTTYLSKKLLVPTGKGTDASNCHDEECDEEEFSDDEQASNRTPERRALCAHSVGEKRKRKEGQGRVPFLGSRSYDRLSWLKEQLSVRIAILTAVVCF